MNYWKSIIGGCFVLLFFVLFSVSFEHGYSERNSYSDVVAVSSEPKEQLNVEQVNAQNAEETDQLVDRLPNPLDVKNIADEGFAPTAEAATEGSGATFAGTLNVFGEVHNIMRGSSSLTFDGTEGRTVEMHSTLTDWETFVKTGYTHAGIVCPWESTQNPGNYLPNCWLIYDDGMESNGSVWAGTYEPVYPNGGLLINLTHVPYNPGNIYSAYMPGVGTLTYWPAFQQYQFSSQTGGVYLTEVYDVNNGGNFIDMQVANDYEFWSIFPTDATWNPASPPPASYTVLLQNWNFAQSWSSIAPLVIPATAGESEIVREIAKRSGVGRHVEEGVKEIKSDEAESKEISEIEVREKSEEISR